MNLFETFSHFNKQVPVLDIWNARRQAAINNIKTRGWPTRKDEAWKYTSLESLKALVLNFQSTTTSPGSAQDLLPDFHHVIFVDGVLSPLPPEIRGLKISSLREALVAKSGPWTKWVGRWEGELAKLRTTKDFTEQISEAFFDAGVCIDVEPNVKLDRPIQIVYLSSNSPAANFSSTQVWINVGKGSVADFVMTSQGNMLQVNQTQLWAHESSRTNFLKFGDLVPEYSDFQRMEVLVEANAEFSSWSVGMGGRIQRNELEVYIKGPGATAKLRGISMVSGQTLIDHHTLIDHVQGGSSTEQLYKGILSDQSRVVFDGQVKIRKGADKASSQQLNKNLILSGSAEVDSKPQLQVLADDVKATHGSATGQINADELFYFQSRGISEQNSRKLLAMGFVDDLIDLHPAESVRGMIKSRMKKAFDENWEKQK